MRGRGGAQNATPEACARLLAALAVNATSVTCVVRFGRGRGSEVGWVPKPRSIQNLDMFRCLKGVRYVATNDNTNLHVGRLKNIFPLFPFLKS